MKRALYILTFLALVPEGPRTWGGEWAPLQYVTSFLDWNPLKVPTLEILFLLLLFGTRDRAPRRRLRSMEKALLVSSCALAVWFLWGLKNGADPYQVQFQLYYTVRSYLLAFVIAKVLITPNDYFTLGKVVFGASVYRSCTVIAVYYARAQAQLPPPDVCTTHGDTVLFVTAMVAAIAYLLEMKRKATTGNALKLSLGVMLLLMAIQFNNRRLAWVSLCGCLVLIYFLLSVSPLRKRINRRLAFISPLVVLYVVVGTGRPERIFSPLRSLSSVKSEDDPSTKSRDNENRGLLITHGIAPVMGLGWGKEYIEVDSSLSAGNVGFAQYKYMPHNSVLGLLAFTGVAGFAAIWVVFPMCLFIHTRTYRFTSSPMVRMAAIVGSCEVLIVINQWWGDIGMSATTGSFIIGASYAAAIRLPLYEDNRVIAPTRTRK